MVSKYLEMSASITSIEQGSSRGFEAHPGTPVPSAPLLPIFITTEGKHPSGSRDQEKVIIIEKGIKAKGWELGGKK
jgi:hypothetical protein